MKSKGTIFSEQLIQPLLDTFSSNIALLDKNCKIILVNQAWRDFGKANGYPDESFGLGMNYFDLCESITGIGADEARQVAEGIRKVLNDEIKEEFVDYPCHSPTENRWYRLKIAKFEFNQKYIILIHTNISMNKVVEENLVETEKFFKQVIEQSSEGISITSVDGKIVEWNKAEEKITGHKREDTLGHYIWDVQADLRPEKSNLKFAEFMKKGVLGLLETGTSIWAGKPNETEIARPDGTHAVIESVIFPIKHNHGYMACSISRDVTELRDSKKAQLLSESRYRTYVDYTPAITMIIDQKGFFIDANPQACKTLGYSQAELFKTNIAQLIPENVFEKSHELLGRLTKEGSASADIQFKKKDGGIIQLFSNAVVLPDKSMMMICNDITELRNFQTKLQESEAFLNSILDNIPSMITVKEAETLKYFKINHPVEEYLGKSSQELLGKTVYDLFPNGEANFYNEQDKLTLKEKHIVDIPIENVFTRDQKQRFFHEKKVPMYGEEGQPRFILSISEDITEQIKLEIDEKAHFDRLEAISKLTTRMQAPASLEEMLPVLLDIILETLHVPMGSIWLYKYDIDELVPVYYTGGGQDNRILVEESLKPGKGIPGMVFQTRETHITQNYNDDPWFIDQKRGKLQDSLGGITLPLRTTNSVIGVINISTTSLRVFSDDDVKLLITLSEIAGNSIQTISLKEQTEQRLMRLSALSAIDRAISSSFDMMVSFEILVSNVISQLKMDAADVLLYNPHSQLLEYSTGQGFVTTAIDSACLRLGESLAGKAAVTREMVVVKNLISSEITFTNQQLAVEGFVSYYGVPLIAKGKLKGVLEAFSRTQHTPDDDWINFLKSLRNKPPLRLTIQRCLKICGAPISNWEWPITPPLKDGRGHLICGIKRLKVTPCG